MAILDGADVPSVPAGAGDRPSLAEEPRTDSPGPSHSHHRSRLGIESATSSHRNLPTRILG